MSPGSAGPPPEVLVIGGGLVISVLRLLQKSEDSAGGSVASELVSGARSWSRRCAWQKAGDGLGGGMVDEAGDGK